MVNRGEELAKALAERAWRPVGELEKHLAILLSGLPQLRATVEEQFGEEKRRLEEEARRLLEKGASP